MFFGMVNKTPSDFMLTLMNCFIVHLQHAPPHISSIFALNTLHFQLMDRPSNTPLLLPAAHHSYGGGGNDPDSTTAATFENRVR